MYIPLLPRAPTKRSEQTSSSNHDIVIICTTIIVCSVFFIIVMSYFVLRTLRRKNCRPKYIPGKFLKEKWSQWSPGIKYGHVSNQPLHSRAQAAAPRSAEGRRGANSTTAVQQPSGVNRETSVRSIVTLPAYSSNPKPTEQVIGREGERAGMDIVVEFPETAEEIEARREELMESQYQMRLRRREWEERYGRGQVRREIQIGNVFRLEQLRTGTQSRRRDRSASAASTGGSGSPSNRAGEHGPRGRTARAARTARVNYAALGFVHHDGSRVRADSAASSSTLLGASALPDGHARGGSASSLRSMSSMSDMATLNMVPSRAHSVAHLLASNDGDIGALNIPPPHYDHLEWGEAPAYESRVLEDHHLVALDQARLPEITPLPSSRASEDNSAEGTGFELLDAMPLVSSDSSGDHSPERQASEGLLEVTPQQPARAEIADPIIQSLEHTEEEHESLRTTGDVDTKPDSSHTLH